MTTDATEESRKVWEAVAPGWERHRAVVFEQMREVSERLVDATGARDGDTILELTAGPGETGMMLAERIPGARVIISDFAPGMVEAAKRGVEARGLTNVECRVIDAQAIDLPDASVDAVMSRYGLMLVPDTKAAAAEIRRVLRPGGRLAYAVWGPLQSNPWMMMFGAAMMQRGHFQPPEGGNLFPLTTEDENREILSSAGFETIDVEVVDAMMPYPDASTYFDVSASVAGPLALIASSLPPEEIAELKALLEQYTTSFRTDDGLRMPSQTIVVRAS